MKSPGTPSIRRRSTKPTKRSTHRTERPLQFEPLENRMLLDAVGWVPDATELGEIRGVLWNDVDGNGVQDIGEPTLPDREVYLDLNQNGVRDDPLEPATLTDPDGSYTFSALSPGNYTVAIVAEEGWRVTLPTVAPNGMQSPNIPGDEFDRSDARQVSISADGRYVAFETGHARYEGEPDQVYVYDRVTGETDLVSKASDGALGDRGSGEPSISADGRYVAYTSFATNIVPDDGNWDGDVYLYDRLTGTTEQISVAVDGGAPNEASRSASISADGRYVAFTSVANNLVRGMSSPLGESSVYVYDRETRSTEWLSAGYDGACQDGFSRDPSISADGRYVTFQAEAPGLVPNDTNGYWDVFLHDRETGTTRRVSAAPDGTDGNEFSHHPAISADGRYIAFFSQATNLDPDNPGSGIYLHHVESGRTELVDDGGTGHSMFRVSISGDGRYLSYASNSSRIVGGDTNYLTDIYVLDRETGTNRRVSLGFDGSEANAHAARTVISADGGYVAFSSRATNLVPGNADGAFDVFVTGITEDWMSARHWVEVQPGQASTGVDFGVREADPIPPPPERPVPAPPNDPPEDDVNTVADGTISFPGMSYHGGLSIDSDTDTGTIYILGTDGHDSVQFIAANPTGSGSDPELQSLHHFIFNGSSSYFNPNENHTFVISEVESVTLTGSDGDDTLVATPGKVTLDGEGYSVEIAGADSVSVDALGGENAASLFDSAGDDVFTARPASSTIEYGSGNTVQVDGFGYVHAYGKQGGDDVASLYDSAGNDVFKGTSTYGKLIYENQTLVRAKFFDFVHAYSKAGGDDVAQLCDSAGDDTFVAGPTFGKMKFEAGSIVRAKFFDLVHAYAQAGGQDVARFVGSAGNDVFGGTPTISKFKFAGDTTVRAKFFENVFANGGTGGHDRAFLTDSKSADLLEADGNHVRLTTTGKSNAEIVHLLSDFDRVLATARTSGDVSRVGQHRSIEFDLEMVGLWREDILLFPQGGS